MPRTAQKAGGELLQFATTILLLLLLFSEDYLAHMLYVSKIYGCKHLKRLSHICCVILFCYVSMLLYSALSKWKETTELDVFLGILCLNVRVLHRMFGSEKKRHYPAERSLRVQKSRNSVVFAEASVT